MPKKITKNGLTININNMEELIKRLREMLAKEENPDVRTGLRLAILEANLVYADQITETFKQIKSN